MNIREAFVAADAAAERNEWGAACQALEGLPDTDEVLDRRGWYLSREKRYDEAVAVFTVLLARRPRDYLPPYMIGFQLYQQERWADSLPYFDDALLLNPQHLKSLWRRAHALDQLGRVNPAMLTAGKMLKIWLNLPPEKQEQDRKRYAQACHLLAKHQMGGDPRGAADLLRKAVEHDPGDPYHHQQLAKALLASHSSSDALAAAIEARRLKPRDTVMELTYCEALHANGDREQARNVLRASERSCRGWSLIRAARLALDVEDPHLAVDLCRRARRDRSACEVSTLDDLEARAAQGAAKVPKPGMPSGHSGRRVATLVGQVEHVREDKGFGFLVDESGIRRFFRLQGSTPCRGERVSFRPTEGEKGPAAREVRPVA
jgi:tetratricopeptide (TPR) repeat protein/cold shock CspA family protein